MKHDYYGADEHSYFHGFILIVISKRDMAKFEGEIEWIELSVKQSIETVG